MNASDLALADDFLDGEMDNATWDLLRAERGPALDAALHQAKALRAALTGLERPALPAALHHRLLSTPRPAVVLRPRLWRITIPIALAAALVLAVLLPRQTAQTVTDAPAPVVARRQVAPAPLPSCVFDSDASSEPPPASAGKAAHGPAESEADAVAPSAPAVTPPAAPPAARASQGMAKLRSSAATPQVIAVWHTPVDAGPAALEGGAAPTIQTAVGENLADTTERVLRISVHNPTSEPMRLAPGTISLIGLSGSGGALWRIPLRAGVETVIPAGEVLTWDQAVPVIPPGAVRLRVDVRTLRSDELIP